MNLEEFYNEVVDKREKCGSEFALGYALGSLRQMVIIERQKKSEPPVSPPKLPTEKKKPYNPTNTDVLNFSNNKTKKELEKKKKRQALYDSRWGKKERNSICLIAVNALDGQAALTTKELMGLMKLPDIYYVKFTKMLDKLTKEGKIGKRKSGRQCLWVHPNAMEKDPATKIIINGEINGDN